MKHVLVFVLAMVTTVSAQVPQLGEQWRIEIDSVGIWATNFSEEAEDALMGNASAQVGLSGQATFTPLDSDDKALLPLAADGDYNGFVISDFPDGQTQIEAFVCVLDATQQTGQGTAYGLVDNMPNGYLVLEDTRPCTINPVDTASNEELDFAIGDSLHLALIDGAGAIMAEWDVMFTTQAEGKFKGSASGTDERFAELEYVTAADAPMPEVAESWVVAVGDEQMSQGTVICIFSERTVLEPNVYSGNVFFASETCKVTLR